MDLDEAIQQQINLGNRDPLEIAKKIEGMHGGEWLAKELLGRSETLVAQMALRRLGQERRSAQLALRPGDAVAVADLHLKTFFIPGVGPMRAADVTAAQLEDKAVWLDRYRAAIVIHADWCRETAALMRKQGAATLGLLQGDLPQLRELEAA